MRRRCSALLIWGPAYPNSGGHTRSRGGDTADDEEVDVATGLRLPRATEPKSPNRRTELANALNNLAVLEFTADRLDRALDL